TGGHKKGGWRMERGHGGGGIGGGSSWERRGGGEGGDEPCWRWSDAYRTTMRIHAKQTEIV
ncbi:MAG: hypothetical protein FWD53_09435, partial [Phycisphaerales bacterium]|nr:hypothetical protein [Phycisphaerales bacterium]